MKKKTVFTVVGGDLRQSHLANLLAEQYREFQVNGMFFDNEDVQLSQKLLLSNDIHWILPKSDIVLFPLPVTTDNIHINTSLSKKTVLISDCLDYITPSAIVMGGRVSARLKEDAAERGIEMIDYFQREELAVLNAVPTAEGAIEIALREIPTTIFGQTCLITGFGRIAKVLAKLLVSFGAKVKIAARKYSDLSWTRIYGCEPVPISKLDEELQDVDILFNTIPAMLLDKEKLMLLNKHSLVIDLASKPGGVDFETARDLGIKTIWALSLPGKTAPISAGEIILDTVVNILTERGIFD